MNKTRNTKTEVRLTCAVVSGVEMTDELMAVVGVDEVVEGIEEDVRVVDDVVVEASRALGKALGANRGTYTAESGK